MSWTAIWDSLGPVRAPRVDLAGRERVETATILLEGRVAQGGPAPVALWSGTGDAFARFDLHRMGDGSVCVQHRDLCMTSEAGLLSDGDMFQIHYRADTRGSGGLLDIRNLDRGHRVLLRPGVPVAPCLTDFMPSRPECLKALGLVAVASHDVPVSPVPGVVAGTPICTPDGPVPVEDLRPGMVVETVQNGPQTVRWTGAREVLCRGSMAPVQLRAPYFGLPRDMTVTANHRILMEGSEVEYLFGEERVYARAGDMIDGSSVRRDQSQVTQVFHHFMLDDHDCVQVGRCRIETLLLADLLAARGQAGAGLSEADSLPRHPTLDRASTQALLTMMAEHRRSAA